MKAFFGFLCLVMIVLSSACFVSVHAAEVKPIDGPCASYQKTYDDARTALEAAQTRFNNAMRAVYEAARLPVPDEYKEKDGSYTVTDKTYEGVSVKLPNTVTGILTGLGHINIMEERNDALSALVAAKTARDEAGKALVLCWSNYHKCEGCDKLIDSEGMMGHLSLLCAANHSYYECDASAVSKHTTTETCKTGAHTLLKCQMSSHKHEKMCYGCMSKYDDLTSDEGYHRLRTCQLCNQSYRNCDRPTPTCSSGLNKDLPCSDYTSNTVEKDTSASNPPTLPCGHAVGSAGIHLQVSCEFCSEQFYFCAEGSEHGLARCPRNDKEETCTVSGGRMILCADPPHVHQYPSDPKQTQADASPTSESNTDKNDGKTNKPDGKTPKQTGASKEMVLAACGVHTIEKGSSSAHSHREVSCRLDGYGNACDPGSYYVCQEAEHRHQYPNTPKGFRKVIVCPAHAWTGCKGTKSHAKTCPAGHSYYTCNKAATAAHEAHTASDASPKSPSKNTPNNDGHSGSNPNNNNGNSNNKGGDSSEGVRKCGHPKSMGGDHSFVASCTETNANGDTCQRTSGYWPCRGQHTHKFPEPEARRKCGHLKSASGDHSFIASCPATNANGDTCQRTSGYWPCKGQHTHLFPESSSSSSSSSSSASSSANNNNDDDSDDASDDDSDGADENLVKCGRPKCGSMVSSASAHKSTCGRGHSYWSCKTEAVAAHLNH